jgi:hypothetical protein
MKSKKALHISVLSLKLCCFFFLLAFTTGDTKSEYTVPRAVYSVNVRDIDLDGDVDIVTGHNYNWQTLWSGISLLKNNGNGYFNLYDSIYLYGGQSNVYATTINEDTFPDLVGQYYDGSKNNIAILVSDSTNYTQNYYQMGQNISAYNIGKLNNDDYVDIVFISNLGQFWGILYNDGTGNFSAPQYHDVSDYYPSDIACADLNDDGRDDIVIGGKTEIFFSYENGFQSLYFNTITSNIKTVDFDNDGDIDIIGAHQPMPTNYYLITLIENLGGENFIILPFYIFQPVCFGLTVSDFNNDSLPELLFHTQDMQNLLIFYNKGNFELSEPQFIPMTDYGEASRRSACADLDGNGFNDIATIRYLHAPIINLNILFNDGNGNFVDDPITGIEAQNPPDVRQNQNLLCFPNPMKNETTFEIEIKETARVELTVYNLQGKPIINLVNNKLEGGIHKIKWDGVGQDHHICNPGPYFAYLAVNGKIHQIIKLLII